MVIIFARVHEALVFHGLEKQIASRVALKGDAQRCLSYAVIVANIHLSFARCWLHCAGRARDDYPLAYRFAGQAERQRAGAQDGHQILYFLGFEAGGAAADFGAATQDRQIDIRGAIDLVVHNYCKARVSVRIAARREVVPVMGQDAEKIGAGRIERECDYGLAAGGVSRGAGVRSTAFESRSDRRRGKIHVHAATVNRSSICKR
jgi:hypothetical protein